MSVMITITIFSLVLSQSPVVVLNVCDSGLTNIIMRDFFLDVVRCQDKKKYNILNAGSFSIWL
jgi:hypothetical protein